MKGPPLKLVQRTKISKPSKDAPIPSLAKPLARAIIAARMLAGAASFGGCAHLVAERTEFGHVRYFQTHAAWRLSFAAGLHRPAHIQLGADAEERWPAGARRRFRAAQSQP